MEKVWSQNSNRNTLRRSGRGPKYLGWQRRGRRGVLGVGRQEFEAAEWFERMMTACVSFSKVVLQRSDSADHEHENHVWPCCMITKQHQWCHIWWHVPRFNPVWPSSSLNFGFRPPPQSFMERNLSDQKLSLCSAAAVLNMMFLTQNLSPYPLFSASSTVVGTCPGPGCKEQTKREGWGGEKGRERDREREREKRETERERERERERAVRPRREWRDTNRMGFSTTEACRSVFKLDYH